MTRPVLGRPRQADLREAVGPRSRARSVFEVQSQQPGNFSLHVQDVCAVVSQLAPRAPGEIHLPIERVFRSQRVAFGRLARASPAVQLPQEDSPALRSRQCDRGFRGEPRGGRQAADVAGLMCSDPTPPEPAVRILVLCGSCLVGRATTSGSGALQQAAGPFGQVSGGLRSSLRSSGERAERRAQGRSDRVCSLPARGAISPAGAQSTEPAPRFL